MPDNQTKVIEIKKVEMTAYETGNQYKVTASDGVKFKFYSTKKDGNETVAYKQFKDMGLKIGSTCEVWFKEMQKEYEGKPYTDRIIASFREAIAKPISKLETREQVYVSPEPKDEKFWDKKAYKQCLWGYWLENRENVELTILDQNEMDLVWQVFNQIEQDADKRFAVGWDKAVKTFGADPLPEPPPDDLNVPF